MPVTLGSMCQNCGRRHSASLCGDCTGEPVIHVFSSFEYMLQEARKHVSETDHSLKVYPNIGIGVRCLCGKDFVVLQEVVSALDSQMWHSNHLRDELVHTLNQDGQFNYKMQSPCNKCQRRPRIALPGPDGRYETDRVRETCGGGRALTASWFTVTDPWTLVWDLTARDWAFKDGFRWCAHHDDREPPPPRSRLLRVLDNDD